MMGASEVPSPVLPQLVGLYLLLQDAGQQVRLPPLPQVLRLLPRHMLLSLSLGSLLLDDLIGALQFLLDFLEFAGECHPVVHFYLILGLPHDVRGVVSPLLLSGGGSTQKYGGMSSYCLFLLDQRCCSRFSRQSCRLCNQLVSSFSGSLILSILLGTAFLSFLNSLWRWWPSFALDLSRSCISVLILCLQSCSFLISFSLCTQLFCSAMLALSAMSLGQKRWLLMKEGLMQSLLGLPSLQGLWKVVCFYFLFSYSLMQTPLRAGERDCQRQLGEWLIFSSNNYWAERCPPQIDNHYTQPCSYFYNYSLITAFTLPGKSDNTFQWTGFFSKENQAQKLSQQASAIHTLLSFLGAYLTSVRILYAALIDFSISEKQLALSGSLAAISANDSLLCMVFLIERKYFSCQRQAFLTSWNCSSLGSYQLNAFSSKRQRQLALFLSTLRAILRLVYWNLMRKQTKIQSEFLEMANSLRIFQNSLVIQLAMLVMFFRQSTNLLMSVTLGENTRDSHTQRQDARSLSSQIRQRLMSLTRVGSALASSSMNLPSVRFWMLSRVLWGLESRKGWQPKVRRQAMQPTAQTSHLKEYFSFRSCSGETQRKVPLSSEKLSTLDISISPTDLAHPKSPILTTPPAPSRMFSGLRSLWMTPLTVMSMNAWKICLRMPSISLVAIFLFLVKWRMRSPCSQYSITICSSSTSSSRWQLKMRTRFGCWNFFMSSISSSAWSIQKGSMWIFLSAQRWPLSSCARQTLPKLPQPMGSITLQDCIDIIQSCSAPTAQSTPILSLRSLLFG